MAQTPSKTIFQALVAAQKNFEAAAKTSNNPHFRSKYAALDACVDAVKEALNNEGIFLLQKTHDCTDGVMVETIFIHESGEQLSGGVLHVPASKHDAQGYGSALTYARRYSLLAACGIAPEDDDGNAATKAPPKPSPAQVKTVLTEMQEALQLVTTQTGVKTAAQSYLDWARKHQLEEVAQQMIDIAKTRHNELKEASNG